MTEVVKKPEWGPQNSDVHTHTPHLLESGGSEWGGDVCRRGDPRSAHALPHLPTHRKRNEYPEGDKGKSFKVIKETRVLDKGMIRTPREVSGTLTYYSCKKKQWQDWKTQKEIFHKVYLNRKEGRLGG